MVRSTRLLSAALLAVMAAAFPRLQIRQDVETPQLELTPDPAAIPDNQQDSQGDYPVHEYADNICFPYEVRTCPDPNLSVPCTCEKPTDHKAIQEGNAMRREFLDKVHDWGMEWAYGAFSVRYPGVYDGWWKFNSSVKQTYTEFYNKRLELSQTRSDISDTAPEIYASDTWSEINSKISNNDTSGLVQIPDTKEWAKEGVTPERLSELTEIVHKHDEAFNAMMAMRDKEEKVKEEFKPWFDEWLKGEEEALKSSENESSKYVVCGGEGNNVQFDTPEEARAHMDAGRYVWEIDDFISRLSRENMAQGGKTKGYMTWPEQYAIDVGVTREQETRDQAFDSCRTLSGDCELFKAESTGTYTCEWFWDRRAEYNFKVAYWVFRLIENVHHKLKLFKDTLVTDTITSGLKLGKLNEDFTPDLPKEDPAWKWFKFAFGMVTSFLPAPPGFDAGAAGNLTKVIEVVQLLIDTFDQVNEEVQKAKAEAEPKPISSADLGAALADIFTSMSNGLLKTLETALGKKERVGQWEELPAFGNTDNLKTPVGKFLNNPIWLIDNGADVLYDSMKLASLNAQWKIIDMKLRSNKYYLTWDKRSTYPKTDLKCDGKGARTINYAGGEKCFRIWWFGSLDPTKSKDQSKALDDAFYDKLAEYGLEGDALTEYYKQILDCYQKKGKDGTLDENDAVKIGGSAPTCYFSLPTMKLDTGKGCTGLSGLVCSPWTPVDLEK